MISDFRSYGSDMTYVNLVVSAYTIDTFKARLDKFWHSQEDIVYDFRAQLQGTGSRSEVLCEKFE